jgi:transcriptional regulator with XRE-family HTH domain
MEKSTGRNRAGRNVAALRERRMWTQVRLAEEAGISPTTVSGIENGRISRPHFGTLRKLAAALGVESETLLGQPGARKASMPESLSLEWSIATNDEEFERGLEEASIERLSALSDELDEEEIRLRGLYEQAREDEQRRLIKGMIRRVADNSGSVEASISAHKDNIPEHLTELRLPQDGHSDTPGTST